MSSPADPAGPSTGRPGPVVVVMGVSGSGKSTVAALVADRLGWVRQEGDDLHPQANVAKMATGTPLTDDDRWPWLDRVADWIRVQQDAGRPGVITCSALRRRYRDRLRGDGVVFVLPAGQRTAIAERLAARLDHFMPAGLLDSQLATLEPPAVDENVLVVEIDGTPTEIADDVVRRLGAACEHRDGPR